MVAKPRLPNVYDVVMKDSLPRRTSTKWNSDVQTDRFEGAKSQLEEQVGSNSPSTRHIPDGQQGEEKTDYHSWTDPQSDASGLLS